LADSDGAEEGGRNVWVRLFKEDEKTIRDRREARVRVGRMANHLGRQNASVRGFIADVGGASGS